MSTASNSVTQVMVTTAMDSNFYRAGEPMARKTERTEASFVETIVGRWGGLRSILSEVEVVAPTDATSRLVYICIRFCAIVLRDSSGSLVRS